MSKHSRKGKIDYRITYDISEQLHQLLGVVSADASNCCNRVGSRSLSSRAGPLQPLRAEPLSSTLPLWFRAAKIRVWRYRRYSTSERSQPFASPTWEMTCRISAH